MTHYLLDNIRLEKVTKIKGWVFAAYFEGSVADSRPGFGWVKNNIAT